MPTAGPRLRSLALLAPLLLASACMSSRVGQRARTDDSLIAIHIDLSRSPSYWRKVTLACEDRAGRRPWGHMRTDGKGLYYREGMPTGRCWITSGFQDGIVTRIYKLPVEADRNPTTKAIGAPGVHYLGSWKFVPKGRDDFELVRVSSPSESEALRRLLPRTQGTAWEGMVRKRL